VRDADARAGRQRREHRQPHPDAFPGGPAGHDPGHEEPGLPLDLSVQVASGADHAVGLPMAETAAVAGLRRTLGDGNPSGNRETRRPPAATPATPPVAAWKAARPAFTAMAVGALNTMMLTRVQVRFGRYLSRRYMTGVLDREFPFFVNRSSGDLIYRANLVMVVEQIVTGSLPSTVVSMVFLVVYLIMMIAYSAPLTMLTLTVCAAVLVVSVIYSLRNRTLVERATVAQADVQRAFIETFSGIVGVISQIMAFATYMRKICEMIPAGEGDKIAIVGPTGSGKSTLLKLLAGLIEPVCGTVTINGGGCRIYDADSRWKAGRLAYVHQESTVFNETLRDNITLHRPWLTDDDIVRACEVAGINEGMMDPVVGLDAMVSERGMNLSGGQRQKVAIARAVVGRPDFLLMDEPTSALDNDTERHVMTALLDSDNACIVVAHRLASIRDFDRIHVMDHGQIVESGTHDELLQAGGLYSRLYRQE
jgi:ATP-binding cassette subfamily B protein